MNDSDGEDDDFGRVPRNKNNRKMTCHERWLVSLPILTFKTISADVP